MAMFSPLLLNHFQQPRNVGEVEQASAVAEVENPVCGDVLRLTLKIEADRIVAARFRAQGCVASIACASLLTELITGKQAQEAAELRSKAELYAADNSGPKLIQVSLALDRLLETVAEVAKDMRDEGTKTIRETSAALIVGSLLIAFLNLLVRRAPATRDAASDSPSVAQDRQQAPPFAPSLKRTDPLLRRE